MVFMSRTVLYSLYNTSYNATFPLSAIFIFITKLFYFIKHFLMIWNVNLPSRRCYIQWWSTWWVPKNDSLIRITWYFKQILPIDTIIKMSASPLETEDFKSEHENVSAVSAWARPSPKSKVCKRKTSHNI